MKKVINWAVFLNVLELRISELGMKLVKLKHLPELTVLECLWADPETRKKWAKHQTRNYLVNIINNHDVITWVPIFNQNNVRKEGNLRRKKILYSTVHTAVNFPIRFFKARSK